MLIRKAITDDYTAIYELNRDCLGYDYPAWKTELRLRSILSRDDNKVIVAETDGKIVGYIHAETYDCTYSDPLLNILALAVRADYRRKGIGRALISALEATAKADGACGIRLVSGYSRSDAHRFYEACGYQNRKDQKNFVKIF